MAFMTKAFDGDMIQSDVIANHEFVSRFPALTKKIKEVNETMGDALVEAKAYYDKYKSLVSKVQADYFSRSAQDLKRDMQRLAPRVNILADIVKDVITAFGQKRSRNILDFADYEHFALQILTNDDGSPSHIAEMYREQFAEILVDEYQDTNRVQEQILSCIKTGSEADGNLFMVGDVKQSIYKFRQADPSLFIEKYQRFNAEGNGTGIRIDLSQNFRSRKEVLSTTNYLFKHMMDEEVGEISYDDAAQLYYGAPFDEVDHPVELRTLIEADKEHSELNGSEQEAEYIVKQVKDILANKRIFDMKTGHYRQPTYKDIVILERSFRKLETCNKRLKIMTYPFT